MNEKLNDALNEIRDDYIADAATLRQKPRWVWIPAVAAVMAVIILASAFFWPEDSGPSLEHSGSASTASTASSSVSPSTNAAEDYLKLHAKVLAQADYSLQKRPDYPLGFNANQELKDFYEKTIAQLLSNTEGKNKVYSPVNLYMALCLAAELSDGNTQVLELLGSDSLESLRQQASIIWNYTYNDINEEYKKVKTTLANSLWLQNGLEYDAEILEILANNYFASAYQANLGAPETNLAIAEWIDQNTGNLLTEVTKEIKLEPDTVFAAVSTVYYQASWESEFSEKSNFEGIFHGTQDAACTYMKKQITGTYYWNEEFTATALRVGSGYMYVFLPAEGKTPEDLLASGDYLDCVYGDTEDASIQSTHININVTMPKFDIHSEGSIKSDWKALGLTDLFDYGKMPFEKFFKSGSAALSDVEQATRVAIDEEGITGASFIIMEAASGGMPPKDEVDLVLDRPFLFVITGGAPLFAGIVNDLS